MIFIEINRIVRIKKHKNMYWLKKDGKIVLVKLFL